MMKVGNVCNRLCLVQKISEETPELTYNHIYKSQLPNHWHLVPFQIPVESEPHNRGVPGLLQQQLEDRQDTLEDFKQQQMSVRI